MTKDAERWALNGLVRDYLARAGPQFGEAVAALDAEAGLLGSFPSKALHGPGVNAENLGRPPLP